MNPIEFNQMKSKQKIDKFETIYFNPTTDCKNQYPPTNSPTQQLQYFALETEPTDQPPFVPQDVN